MRAIHPTWAVCAAAALVLLLSVTQVGKADPTWTELPGLYGVVTNVRSFWQDELWSASWKAVYSYDSYLTRHSGGALPAGQYLAEAYTTSSGMFLFDRDYPSTGHSYLARSENGYANFETVLDFGTSAQGYCLHRSLVDVGNGSLLFFEYDRLARVFASTDSGQSWSLLMQPPAGILSHFHGARYDPVYNKLYVMTGDSALASTILVCDDVFGSEGLVQDPSLWQTRWGLCDVYRATLDANYAVVTEGATQSTKNRAVDMAFYGDWAYWAQDTASPGGQRIYRVNRATGQTERVGTGTIKGAGWMWLVTEDGYPLLFTDSEVNASGAYLPGHDQYIHVYAVIEDGSAFTEITKFQRSDASKPSGSSFPGGLAEGYGTIWLWGYRAPAYNCYAATISGGLMPPIPGDANGDGLVDSQDFSILKTHFGMAGGWDDGDFNNDGLVDSQDFSILKDHFGERAIPGDEIVPEPTTVTLLTLGATPGIVLWNSSFSARLRRRSKRPCA